MPGTDQIRIWSDFDSVMQEHTEKPSATTAESAPAVARDAVAVTVQSTDLSVCPAAGHWKMLCVSIAVKDGRTN